MFFLAAASTFLIVKDQRNSFFLSLTFDNLTYSILQILQAAMKYWVEWTNFYKHVLLNFAHEAYSNKSCLVFKEERYPSQSFNYIPKEAIICIIFKIHRGLIQKLTEKTRYEQYCNIN